VIFKSIIALNSGFNPSIHGDSIRVLVPRLTEERRKNLIKVIRSDAEKARIFMRNIRREGKMQLKQYEKKKLINSDEGRKALVQIQSLTTDYINKINTILFSKEKDLMTI
ncbi:ribosome recycling factor, partial [Buchnera aphidicola (Hormaphis cornu)]